MASIIKRNNNFCVVYSYKDANGTPKQKWETFTDLSDAKNRKKEVEYKESVGTFVVPQCKTLNDLLPEYVALYGKSKWALSTYQANTALIANYIAPLIGSMKLQDISTRVIEGYYQRLLKYEAADPMCGRRKHQFVSPGTVRSVHKILRSAFEQAVKWELMEKNPCIYATLPKYTSKKRDIWTAETLFRALKVCDDPKLRLCINLSFSCSLRLGELLGLTWDCVDISPESIEAGRASIYQIVDLLVDTCSTKRKMLRIAGDDKPAEVVRSRFMKLNADHIRFVLKCLAENSSPIRNMKQYLLASLYNAPTTMQLSYQNQTNHDLAMRK